MLEQRKKAEEEEERWREQQKQREKKLQRVVSKRAQANDPHLALSQTHQSKLREFRYRGGAAAGSGVLPGGRGVCNSAVCTGNKSCSAGRSTSRRSERCSAG